MKKALIFVLALVLLVGVFAACGDKPAETTGPATTAAPADTTKPATTKPATTEPATTEPVTTEPLVTEEEFSTVPYDPQDPSNQPGGEVDGFEFPVDPNPNEDAE